MSEKPKYTQLRATKANDVIGSVKRVFGYIFRRNKFKFTVAIIGYCISALTGVLSSYFFTPIINNYVVPYIGEENPDLTGFIRMLVLMAVIYFVGMVSSYIGQKFMSIVSTGMLNDLRQDLFAKMQKLPVRFFDTRTHGQVMILYTNDIDIIRPMIGDGLPTLIRTTITLISCFIMMFMTNVKLTLVVLIALFVIFIVTYVLAKGSRSFFGDLQKQISNVNGYSEEMFSGQKVVKVFCHEKENIEGFEKLNNELYYNSFRTNAFASILMPINQNLAYITYAIVAVLGAKSCIEGLSSLNPENYMTLGALTSFLLYVRQFAGPVSNLSQQFNGIMMSLAGAERVFDLLDVPSEVDEGLTTLVNVTYNDEGKLVECEERTGLWAWKKPEGELVILRGDVRLEHVNFSYNKGHQILNDISLYAKPGQKIAFVGSTGAGKTTITNLLNRFYDIEEGTITYDGINIKDIKKDDLRKSLGMVLQDTNLFNGTVLDNIRYGRLDATDEECIAAAKRCNADSFISRMPKGYNTMLTGNGSNLSQGQRQLLNIARCCVADPPVMILDEATSSIDTHTEKLIEKGMDELMEGRTTFVIAHRLSTIRNSNAIMVLENGEIIERGDHDDLIKNKGRYYQLYTGKAELD